MVYLHRIYTKAGDFGETQLGNGARVPKTSLRIRAYGGVDELNSVLGVAAAVGFPDGIRTPLAQIQNDLFDVGADLCVPHEDADDLSERPPLRVTAAQVEALESWIDEATERLAPLASFVLPGGSRAAAALHWARTVCRRVEIGVVELAETETVNPQVTIYLNRLSDLLFVWARVCNNDGADDQLWVPGQHR